MQRGNGRNSKVVRICHYRVVKICISGMAQKYCPRVAMKHQQIILKRIRLNTMILNQSIPSIPKEGGEMDVTEVYRRIVKENISYETLYSNLPIMQRRMLDEMVELMVEVLAVNRKVLRIGGTDYPYQW